MVNASYWRVHPACTLMVFPLVPPPSSCPPTICFLPAQQGDMSVSSWCPWTIATSSRGNFIELYKGIFEILPQICVLQDPRSIGPPAVWLNTCTEPDGTRVFQHTKPHNQWIVQSARCLQLKVLCFLVTVRVLCCQGRQQQQQQVFYSTTWPLLPVLPLSWSPWQWDNEQALFYLGNGQMFTLARDTMLKKLQCALWWKQGYYAQYLVKWIQFRVFNT